MLYLVSTQDLGVSDGRVGPSAALAWRRAGNVSHPNEELLRTGYAAFGAGDIDTVMSLFADDIVWHVGGSSQLAGDYRGHQEVLGFFGKLIEVTGGTFKVDVHDILANDEHGIALVTATAEHEGKTLVAREVNIWHVADGKATEFWIFAEDQAALDEFFG